MTNLGSNDTEEPAGKAAPVKKGLGLSPVQVIAGGAAAAVASVIGGHLGLAGTVVGAFILSVVSGIALPLFRTSLEKSHEQIRRVAPRRATDAARRTSPPLAADTSGIVRATSSNVSAVALPVDLGPSGSHWCFPFPWHQRASVRYFPGRDNCQGRQGHVPDGYETGHPGSYSQYRTDRSGHGPD